MPALLSPAAPARLRLGRFAPPAPPPPGSAHATPARWVRPALVALLALTALAYLWDLSASGSANSFYAAAVEAGTKSWKAFFFGSIDSSNFITVDKPPAALWVMELSARLFGFSSWSMLVPQALEGVAAVGVLYATVKRWFGAPAGLLAGAALATTPVAALMFRFNNPDAFLVLLLVASAAALTRALEKADTRWVVAAGALLGLAFLAKMLQAFTVLPAFALVYLAAAPTTARRRLWQAALGAASIVVAAGWWVAIVALWPASSRPMIDGSPDNSILNLIFGYNGLSRLTGGSGNGGGFSGATGLFRLFNDLMGGQASWLLPAALVVLVGGLAYRWRAPRTDRTRAALVLWGGWLVVTGAVFSFSSGVIHTYYMVALAPPIGALVGIGGALFWRHRDRLAARLLAAATVVLSALWSFVLLGRTPSFQPWLRPSLLAVGLAGAGALAAAPSWRALRRPVLAAGTAASLAACLAGPLAYSVATVTTPHAGSVPSAGPAVETTAFGPGGAGAGAPASGRGRPTGAFAGPGGSTTSRPASSTGPGGAATDGRAVLRTGSVPGSRSGVSRVPSAGSLSATGGLGARGGAAAGAGATVTEALASLLESDHGRYRWAAATFGSQSAAALELASGGEPVMAIGGFNGEGGNLSLGAFEHDVADGEIHYFVVSGAGGGGPGGGQNSEAAILAWVESHFTKLTVGGQTVYDLASPTT